MRDLFIFLGIFVILSACDRDKAAISTSPTPFLNVEINGLDSVLATMTTAQKVGQLIMVRSDLTNDTTQAALYQALHAVPVSGFFIKNSNLHSFSSFLDSAQSITQIPLMIGSEEEALLNNQFSDLLPLPDFSSVQATGNDTLVKKIQELHARQANQLGVNLSFSANYASTAIKPDELNQIKSLNQHGILSGAKRIPAGTILSLRDSSCQLDGLNVPFEELLWEGTGAFYLSDLETNTECGPSFDLLRYYLREEIGFHGLVFADFNENTSVVQLLKAGVDVFVTMDEPALLFNMLLAEVNSGKLSSVALDNKVRRVLMAKNWVKKKPSVPQYVEEEQPIVLQASFKPLVEPTMVASFLDEKGINNHFKDEKWDLLRYRIYEKSMVLVNNKEELLPLKSLQDRNFRVIHYGPSPLSTFKTYFSKYADAKYFHHGPDSPDVLSILRPSRSEGKTTVITLDEVALRANRDSAFIQALNDLAAKSEVIIINFGEAENFQPFDTSLTLIQVFERNDITESLAAQLIFGGVGASGQLPASINAHFPEGHGLAIDPIRIKYGIPQEVGIAPEKLVGIDAIIKTAIAEGAMPGCQVLVAKDGNVIYSKAFGHHTFQKKQAVKTTDLYDLASITKVAATTLATMKLYDEGNLKLDNRLYEVLDWKEKSTIRYISLKKLLTHQSGLQPNMPIAPYIMYRDVPNAGCDSFFCKNYSETYSVKVADNFYFDQSQVDKIWERIHSLPVGSQRRYRYSDVNFILLQKVAETISKQPLNKQLDEHFYGPLGLRYNMFNPTNRFDPQQIVPTQNDYRWRHQLVRGYVHDESAALLGGVAGNAGLFSNAEDLAIPFQMLLNKGTYAGHRFLKPETVELFTKTHTSSRRGLGFYKPFQDSDYTVSPSAQTFGHTGFTGTAVWADPEHNLLYIFLSNRIHPSVHNKAFSRSRVRQRVQQVVYDALDTYEFEMPELPQTPEGEAIKG